MAAISYEQPDPSYRAENAHAQSNVKQILKSPAHYLASKQRKFAPTLTMQIGSALHCLVLEGREQFDRDFVLKPDGINLTTKEGKEWKQAAGKRTVLSKSDQYASWDAVHGMAESLWRLPWFNPDQSDYRKYNELSLYWTAQGLDCKARLDRLVLTDDQALVLDLKTTDSIDSKKFLSKVLGDMNYLFQAGWYAEAAEAAFHRPAGFVFIGIERTPPYATRIFEVSRDMLREATRQTIFARKTLVECLKTKQWGPPPVEHEVMELPAWYRSPLDDTMEQSATTNDLDAAFDI
jgi:hypothetical protein